MPAHPAVLRIGALSSAANPTPDAFGVSTLPMKGREGGKDRISSLPSMGRVASAASRVGCHSAFLFAAPILVLAAPVFAREGSSARSFVTRLYAHYPRAESQSDFDPLTAPVENRFFDPDLVRLLDEDRRLAQGEVGSLDGDPLCNCQDDGGMRFEVRSVRATGPNAATATIIRHAAPGDTPEVEPITLDLVRLASGWRIRDVHGVDMASLKAMLESGIREMKAR